MRFFSVFHVFFSDIFHHSHFTKKTYILQFHTVSLLKRIINKSIPHKLRYIRFSKSKKSKSVFTVKVFFLIIIFFLFDVFFFCCSKCKTSCASKNYALINDYSVIQLAVLLHLLLHHLSAFHLWALLTQK